MNKLKETIINDIKTAMKEKDTVTRDVLRIVKGEIERKEDSAKELSTGEIVRIIKNLIESSTSTGDVQEVEVLEKYVPTQLTESEIIKIVNERKTTDGLTSLKDMGKIMKYFVNNHDGCYDGALLSAIVKSVLGN